jgi:hypothetical protein
LSIVCGVSVAKDSIKDLIGQIKGINKEKVAYDYSLVLVQENGQKKLDEIKGRLYRYKNHYLDSNTEVINVRDGLYALQIKPSKRLAYLKSIRQVELAAKGQMSQQPGVLYDLNNLIEMDLSSSLVVPTKEGGKKITVNFRASYLKSVEAILDSAGRIEQLKMVILSERSATNTLFRVLTMHNFQDAFSTQVISTKRFLETTNATYKLKGRYKDYHIKLIKY